MWSFRRCSSLCLSFALLVLSGTYFKQIVVMTLVRSSNVRLRAYEDSISARTRSRSSANVSNSSIVMSSIGGLS